MSALRMQNANRVVLTETEVELKKLKKWVEKTVLQPASAALACGRPLGLNPKREPKRFIPPTFQSHRTSKV